MTFLSGYKTYIVAVAMIVYALSGLYIHAMDQQTAALYIFNALGFSGIRAGITSALK